MNSTPTESTTTEILVGGMTCSHCVMSVTEEISELEGVRDVTVDLRAGDASPVIITSTAPLDPDRVRAAIEVAGYTVEAQP